MKVLYVVHSFPPFHWRGTEVYAMELAVAMSRYHEPRVFHLVHDPGASGVTLEDAEFRGLQVHRARMKVNPESPDSYFFNAEQEAVFAGFLNRTRPEVVHFLYFTGGLSLDLPMIVQEHGQGLVMTVTDFSGICPRGQMLDGKGERCPGPKRGLNCLPCLFDMSVFSDSPRLDLVLREYLPLWLMPARPGPELELVRKRLDAVRAAFSAARLLIFPNQNASRLYHLAGLRGSLERVMDYGMDTTPFASHEKTGSPHVRIGFIGQLLAHKGLHVLADALHGLAGEWRLLVYGSLDDPGSREYCEPLAFDPGRAEFLGTFAFERMNEVLEGIDILVTPSIWDENCPLIVKYAIVTGTIAVLADQPGMVAKREGLDRVIFFTPGDGGSLRAALAKAIAMVERERREGSGKAAMASAVRRALEAGSVIDIKDQAKTLREIYES